MEQILLGEIKGKVDLILQRLDQQAVDHEKIKDRVNLIEKQLKWATGIVSTVTFFFAMTSDFLLSKLGLK